MDKKFKIYQQEVLLQKEYPTGNETDLFPCYLPDEDSFCKSTVYQHYVDEFLLICQLVNMQLLWDQVKWKV